MRAGDVVVEEKLRRRLDGRPHCRVNSPEAVVVHQISDNSHRRLVFADISDPHLFAPALHTAICVALSLRQDLSQSYVYVLGSVTHKHVGTLTCFVSSRIDSASMHTLQLGGPLVQRYIFTAICYHLIASMTTC